MRVLLIEDSPRLRGSVGRGLRKAGYVVDVSGDGKEGLWLAESNEYDSVVLDLMLPGLDGLSVLRQLRDQENNVPVLILTARDTVDDRVRGLRLGADDYLIKPFALEELLARVHTLCRRRYGRKNVPLVIGDLEIDTVRRQVTHAGEILELAPREFSLLEYLALRRGEVVSRSDIEAHLYGESAELMSNAIDSAISSLRRKLGASDTTPLIHTRRGMGYVLEVKPA
jgi:DNA-binding response OmpR family regulator